MHAERCVTCDGLLVRPVRARYCKQVPVLRSHVEPSGQHALHFGPMHCCSTGQLTGLQVLGSVNPKGLPTVKH